MCSSVLSFGKLTLDFTTQLIPYFVGFLSWISTIDGFLFEEIKFSILKSLEH
eukprot:c21566_g1_i1 orf=300-455(+)